MTERRTYTPDQLSGERRKQRFFLGSMLLLTALASIYMWTHPDSGRVSLPVEPTRVPALPFRPYGSDKKPYYLTTPSWDEQMFGKPVEVVDGCGVAKPGDSVSLITTRILKDAGKDIERDLTEPANDLVRYVASATNGIDVNSKVCLYGEVNPNNFFWNPSAGNKKYLDISIETPARNKYSQYGLRFFEGKYDFIRN